jgi:hypothetical protein
MRGARSLERLLFVEGDRREELGGRAGLLAVTLRERTRPRLAERAVVERDELLRVADALRRRAARA